MGLFRKVGAFVGAAAITAAGLALGASPAQAASNPSLVAFDSYYPGPSGWVCTGSAGSVRMNPGDSLAMTWTVQNGGTAGGFNFTGPTGDITVLMSTFSPSSVSFSTLGTYRLDPSRSFGCNLTVSVVSEPVEAPPAHDYFQQVGVPASGSCADVPTWAGHWPGFPIGGWSKSWAWWIYDGRGGPVCHREVEVRPNGTVVLIG